MIGLNLGQVVRFAEEDRRERLLWLVSEERGGCSSTLMAILRSLSAADGESLRSFSAKACLSPATTRGSAPTKP